MSKGNWLEIEEGGLKMWGSNWIGSVWNFNWIENAGEHLKIAVRVKDDTDIK